MSKTLTTANEPRSYYNPNQEVSRDNQPLDDRGYALGKFPVWVSVQSHDRAHGGPEEGGWWYDTYQRLDVHEAHNAEELRAIVAKYHTQYDNCGNYKPSESLCDGWNEVHYTQELPPEHEPAVKPHYE